MVSDEDILTHRARIAAVATVVPPTQVSQELADGLLTKYYAKELQPRSLAIMHQILAHPSIKRRYVAVATPADLPRLKNEDPDVRIQRFTQWATALSSEAVDKSLLRANVDKKDVSVLVVNTCTGYICPGISTYVIEACGLRSDIFAYDMVGSGCGGAVPNLQVAAKLIQGNPHGVALSVSVEICTATYQMADDMSLIVSNAIFGDGAGAAVIWNRAQGLELIDTQSHYFPGHREDVRYIYRRGQLHNKLSQQLPRLIGDIVPGLVQKILGGHGLAVPDIKHWAIHPGGDKMVSVLTERLGLSLEQIKITRGVLADYGNMSSPTVFFELERILAGVVLAGEWCCMVAFGAGLSVHIYLLRA
ncbi:MAG: type III polyketide synthase [Chitinivibrionales bacterium]|nr:type III polyketide synthase [Chitinivibrionales bacterium]